MSIINNLNKGDYLILIRTCTKRHHPAIYGQNYVVHYRLNVSTNYSAGGARKFDKFSKIHISSNTRHTHEGSSQLA
ncbi:hypothetical protein FSHL1_002026 [Fusarium sambucinum]